ncbi:MAG: 3-keto-5-aminohexanoate cleavage protein [Firmicutes bacterium]|nr:3-keto-5-aminohexanoate cleavage protein [Bacillota bacterium]
MQKGGCVVGSSGPPLVIVAAICGAETTREDNPNLPLTPEELAEAATLARAAGAAMVHLHVRDQAGRPTQDREVFRRTMELIRAQSDILIQVSTGGAVGMTLEERAQPLELDPDMATLTCGTVNFGEGVFLNPPDGIRQLARRMLERGIRPELEILDVGMLAFAQRLEKEGLIKPPLHFDLVLGVRGGIPGGARNLVHLVESLPPGATWSVAGIGRWETPMGAMAIAMGGHVRVGLEDNVYYHRGVLAESNAQLVARMARIAAELGRPVADPATARQILGLPEGRPQGSAGSTA